MVYFINGLILSFIYDYYSPYNRTICQHIQYTLMYPIMFYYGMI